MGLDEEYGGLALWQNFDDLGLRTGHRLIESGQVKDLHAMNDIQLPVRLQFFDSANCFGLNLVCPLFQVPGVTVECIHLVAMHILDLGVCQYLIGTILYQLLTNNFSMSKKRTLPLRLHDSLLHLRRRIRAYYIASPRVTSNIDKISLKMFMPSKNGVAPQVARKSS